LTAQGLKKTKYIDCKYEIMNWLRKTNERVYHHFIKFTRTFRFITSL